VAALIHGGPSLSHGITALERARAVVCVCIAVLLFLAVIPPDVAAANSGPWTAQVVDADTKRPLGGVNVLAVFYTWPKPGFWARLFDMPPPARVFRASVETATDKAGRFTVVDPLGANSADEVEFYIFTSGYGPWRFQLSSKCDGTLGREQIECQKKIWDQFASEGVEIELRPLATEAERRQYFDKGWRDEERSRLYRDNWTTKSPFSEYWLDDVPGDRLVTLQRFIDSERAALDLPPRPLGGRRQEH